MYDIYVSFYAQCIAKAGQPHYSYVFYMMKRVITVLILRMTAGRNVVSYVNACAALCIRLGLSTRVYWLYRTVLLNHMSSRLIVGSCRRDCTSYKL